MGLSFTAKAVRRWLPRVGVQTLFIEPGSPWENGYVESFNGKLRDEHLNVELFDTLLEAQVADGALALRVQPAAPAQLARLPATGAGGHTTAAHAWTARARSGSNLARIHRTRDPIRLPGHANRCPSEAGMMVCEQPIDPEQGAPVRCDHRTASTGLKRPSTTTAWWPTRGLLLPATLAQHLGLQQLIDAHLDLGAAPGRANVGDKLLTLIASALAGGDCIDDADALRAGRTASVLGCAVKAPSTLGTFLRSFRWGHVRQLDRVTRELLARAWATGAGPGAAPFTIDLDSTICETYGLAKEGARHHGYTGVRGYHPLLAVAAGSGDVLMARLREGPCPHRPGGRPLPA